jgi:protein-tyrosine-phosphatase
VDTAAVLGDAMRDYVLAAGTSKAPATRAPEHMAAWLEAHGYQIVRTRGTGPVGPDDRDRLDRIAALINARFAGMDDADRSWIVRQVLAAVAADRA